MTRLPCYTQMSDLRAQGAAFFVSDASPLGFEDRDFLLQKEEYAETSKATAKHRNIGRWYLSKSRFGPGRSTKTPTGGTVQQAAKGAGLSQKLGFGLHPFLADFCLCALTQVPKFQLLDDRGGMLS